MEFDHVGKNEENVQVVNDGAVFILIIINKNINLGEKSYMYIK